MPDEAGKIVYQPIAGLNKLNPALLIDDRQTPEAQNMRVKKNELKTKEGYDVFGSSASEDIMKILEWEIENVRYLTRVTPTKLQWYNNVDWQDVTVSGTSITGTNLSIIDDEVIKLSGTNAYLFTNYGQYPFYWGGGATKYAQLTTDLKFRYVVQLEGYTIGAYINDGSNEYPDRFQWPNESDPKNWTIGAGSTAGYQDVDDDGGLSITALKVYRSRLIIGKSASIWMTYLTGDATVFAAAEQLGEGLGWEVNNTVVCLPNGEIIGLGRTGLTVLKDTRVYEVGQEVVQDIKDTINPEYVTKAWAFFVPDMDEYHLYVPTGDNEYPTVIYKYNYKTGQIYKDTATNITAGGFKTQKTDQVWNQMTQTWNSYTQVWNAVPVKALFPLMLLGDNSGQVYAYSEAVKNEAGVAIPSHWDSKDYFRTDDRGDLVMTHWDRLDIDMKGDKVDIFYSDDSGKNYYYMTTIYLTADYKKYKVSVDVVSELIRYRFRNYYGNSGFYMQDFIVFPNPRYEKSV